MMAIFILKGQLKSTANTSISKNFVQLPAVNRKMVIKRAQVKHHQNSHFIIININTYHQQKYIQYRVLDNFQNKTK